jgi:mannose-6-phosphate isomerase-like protein (cupin superfamily)
MIDAEVRDRFKAEMADLGLSVKEIDDKRPWGGEFIFDENQLDAFIKLYFPKHQADRERLMTPKLLIVAPEQRLSWQYHDRRGEIWHVLAGPVGLVSGSSDEQPPAHQLDTGEDAEIGSRIRHRLVGMDGWGVVAELWVNDNPKHPSTEDDIVRVEDDYSRR